MLTILQIIAAFLGAIGLLSLGWILFGRLLAPVGKGIYAVVPASGDGESLERDVTGLLWLRGGELARFTVVIADAGLTDCGRAVARILAERNSGVFTCPLGALSQYLSDQ